MKEIGSEFEFDPCQLEGSNKSWSKYFPYKNRVFLSTGRDSLVYAIRAHNLRKMLVPSYLEASIIDQIKKEGTNIEFYRISSNLITNLVDIKNKICNADSLLVIHYFGFPQPIREIKKLYGSNITILEDCVQSMLSTHAGKPIGSFGDVSFNSLRKFIAVPDGSILTTSKKTKVIKSTKHNEFIKKRMQALIGKYNYLTEKSNYNRFYFKDAFTEAEQIIDKYPKPAPISYQSLKILKRTNFSLIIRARRRNFKFLLSGLRHISFYKRLPRNVCPLGFPIIVKNRNKVRNILINNKIYPPIHWILPKEIGKNFEESHYISSHILTIPIDQRYSIDDMKRVIEILRSLE